MREKTDLHPDAPTPLVSEPHCVPSEADQEWREMARRYFIAHDQPIKS